MGNATDSAKQLGCILDAMSATSSLGNAYYIIPSYQRGFKWSDVETNRLLGEIWGYYHRYIEHITEEDQKNVTAKFVGTIIRVPASKSTVDSIIRERFGGSIACKLLIDGQQRLTVFTLLVICLLRRAVLYWNELDPQHFSTPQDSALLETDNKPCTVPETMTEQCSKWARRFVRDSLMKDMMAALTDNDNDDLTPRIVREGEDRLRSASPEDFKSVTTELVYREWIRQKKGRDGSHYDGIVKDNVRVFSPVNSYRFLNSQFNENFRIVINIIDDFLDGFCRPDAELIKRSKCECIEEVIEKSFDNKNLVKAFVTLHPENEDSLLRDDPLCHEVMRLATFWFFLKQYVFLAIVDCDSDNELDIFESLNTAGRALSPVETFIPEVHKYFGKLKNGSRLMHETTVPFIFSNSEEARKATSSDLNAEHPESNINDILTSLRLYGEKDNADNSLPADILTSFAIILDGSELGSAPSGQRDYLKKSFESATLLDKKSGSEKLNHCTDFLVYLTLVTEWWRSLSEARSLSESANKLANFYRNNIFVEDIEANCISSVERDRLKKLENQAQMALAVLQSAGFKLPISIACRFYIAYRYADKSQRLSSYEEFLKALRSLAAFTVFWISSHDSSTARIETKFREALSGAGSLCQKECFTGLSIYTNKIINGKNYSQPLASDLKFILRKQLSNEFDERFTLNEWIKRLSISNPANRKAITKFMILCYWHLSMISKDYRGLRVRKISGDGNKGDDYLNLESWQIYSHYDLEHVLPQKPSEQWATIVDIDAADITNLTQSLGNVTLLPISLNRSLGNSGWDQKKTGLKALILKTENDVALFLNNLKGKEKRAFEDFIRVQSKLTKTEASLEELADDQLLWNRTFITDRTACMARVIWENLQDFLDLPSVGTPDLDIADGAKLSESMRELFEERKTA